MLTWRFYPSDDLEKIPCGWNYHTKRRQKNRSICAGSTLPKREIKSFIFKLGRGVYACVSSMLCLVTRSCLTLCDPLDCSPQVASVHDVSQARMLDCLRLGCHFLLQGIFRTPKDWTCVSCLLHLLHWKVNSSYMELLLTPVSLPGKSNGQRSLAGCSPWGWKESDMT